MDENISPWRSCDIRKLGRWSSPLKAIPQKSITRRSGFVAVTPRAKFIVYARKVEIIVRNLFKCNKIRGTTGSSGSASGSVGIMLLRARARARGRGWGWARGEGLEGTRMPRFLNRNYSQQNCVPRPGRNPCSKCVFYETRNTCGERYCLPGSKYDDREGRKLGK